jgi:hypothetical protein
VPATPALHIDAESIADEPDAEQRAAKLLSKLEQWWLEHRKGVVSGVKTVLEVASKVLEDIPAGGSTAAMVLDFASKSLERVQVRLARPPIATAIRLMLSGAAILGECGNHPRSGRECKLFDGRLGLLPMRGTIIGGHDAAHLCIEEVTLPRRERLEAHAITAHFLHTKMT